jgi:membrane dipeptidase
MYFKFLSLALSLLFIFNLCPVQSQIPGQKGNKQAYILTENSAKEIVTIVLKLSPVIDGHNDLFVHYFDCGDCPKDLTEYRIDTSNTGQTDIPRWRKGGVGGVLLNVFGREKNIDSYLQAWDLLYRMENTYSSNLKIVSTSAEMKEMMQRGKIAILPSLEGAVRLGNNMYLLRTYYKLGLRSVTFAYNTNQLADGSNDTAKYNGISEWGKEMVKEMNRLGILIDMSHISSKAMNDILDITKSPVIFSHSNAKALCEVTRNVPDEVLLRLKQNKGIIMLTPVPYFTTNEYNNWLNRVDSLENILMSRFQKNPGDSTVLDNLHMQWEKENPAPVVTIFDLADHFDYIKKLIGVDYIGIGGDYDGIHYTIKGMEDANSYPMFLTELARRGWTEKELRQITSENFLRVFKEVELKAAQLQKELKPSLVTYSGKNQ